MGAVEKIAKHQLPAPAFWAALAFAAGIFVSALVTNHFLFWFAFSASAGVCTIYFHRRADGFAANLSILILLAGLGGIRYSAATDVAAGRSVANFAGLNKRILISGRVCELADVKNDRTRLYLDEITIGWKNKIQPDGKIRLSIGCPVTSYTVGDRIDFVGLLDSLWPPANPGSPDFARLMRIRGVKAVVYLRDEKGISLAARNSVGWRGRLAKARNFVESKLTEGLPPKAAGVIRGFVLGDTRNIEPATHDLFRKTGTLHLLAVSGANVAWVALLPILLLKFVYLSLRWRYIFALGLVWGFVFFTDLQASVLRAAIMFSFWTVSKIIYREVSGVQSLGLSALLLLGVNPLLFFDIGFELSYLAAFSLIFFSFKEREKSDYRSLRGLFVPFLTTPLVAFLATFPLIAFYFNQITPVSLLSNLFAVPLAMVLTWSSFLFGFLNLFGVGSSFGGGMVLLFDALFRIQQFFTGRSFFHFVIPHPDGWTTFMLFLTVFALLVFVFKSEWRKAGAYLFVSGLIPLAWLPGLKEKPQVSVSVLEAKGEVVSVLSMLDRTIIVGGEEMREAQRTAHQVFEPYLAYLGKERIDGYLPLRFDSAGQAASTELIQDFQPGFIGWPTVDQGKEQKVGPAEMKFEYLQAVGDSVPFALRMKKEGLTFLFLPQVKKFHPPRWDSLLAGPTILVAPLEPAQAESLSHLSNMKAVVSTLRVRRPSSAVSGSLFFTFRDGAVTFRIKDKGWMVQARLSGRKLALGGR